MRLIDADKYPCTECFNEFHCNTTYCAEFEEWLQKPAYDIDKVVENLEVNGKCVGIDSIDCPVKYCCDCEENVISIKRAIEIVKQMLKEQK